MAGGLDELIEFLMERVALQGDQGSNFGNIRSWTQEFYDSQPSNPQLLSFASSLPPEKPRLDDQFIRAAWDWLVHRDDTYIKSQKVSRKDHLSSLSTTESVKDTSATRTPGVPANESTRNVHQPGQNHAHVDGNHFQTPLDGKNPDQYQSNSKMKNDGPASLNGENGRPLVQQRNKLGGNSHAEGAFIFADEESTWHAIAGHGVDHRRIPRMHFQILSIVSSAGKKGILQPDIVAASGQDKRSLPKRTDDLHNAGYIEKKRVIGRAARTSLCTLKRFVAQNTEGPQYETIYGDSETKESVFEDGLLNIAQYTDNTLQMVKEADIMPVEHVKKRLGASGNRAKGRLVYHMLSDLESYGLIKRIGAPAEKSGGGECVVRCVRFVRSPNDRERADLIAGRNLGRPNSWKKHGKQAMLRENDQKHDDTRRLNNDSDEEADASKPTGETIHGLCRSWTPNRPLLNLLFDAIEDTGTKGCSSMTLWRTVGFQFWRRPLENTLNRLTDVWEETQPPHLHHFTIVKDTSLEKRATHYLYRSFDNFQSRVHAGSSDWQAVRIDENDDPNLSLKKSRALCEPDQWGFPKFSKEEFLSGDGTATVSDCASAIKSLDKKANKGKSSRSRIPTVPKESKLSKVSRKDLENTGRPVIPMKRSVPCDSGPMPGSIMKGPSSLTKGGTEAPRPLKRRKEDERPQSVDSLECSTREGAASMAQDAPFSAHERQNEDYLEPSCDLGKAVGYFRRRLNPPKLGRPGTKTFDVKTNDEGAPLLNKEWQTFNDQAWRLARQIASAELSSYSLNGNKSALIPKGVPQHAGSSPVCRGSLVDQLRGISDIGSRLDETVYDAGSPTVETGDSSAFEHHSIRHGDLDEDATPRKRCRVAQRGDDEHQNPDGTADQTVGLGGSKNLSRHRKRSLPEASDEHAANKRQKVHGEFHGDGDTASTERIRQLHEEFWFMRRPGLYINPPQRRQIKRGRPRKQKLLVFKFDQLRSFDWFKPTPNASELYLPANTAKARWQENDAGQTANPRGRSRSEGTDMEPAATRYKANSSLQNQKPAVLKSDRMRSVECLASSAKSPSPNTPVASDSVQEDSQVLQDLKKATKATKASNEAPGKHRELNSDSRHGLKSGHPRGDGIKPRDQDDIGKSKAPLCGNSKLPDAPEQRVRSSDTRFPELRSAPHAHLAQNKRFPGDGESGECKHSTDPAPCASTETSSTHTDKAIGSPEAVVVGMPENATARGQDADQDQEGSLSDDIQPYGPSESSSDESEDDLGIHGEKSPKNHHPKPRKTRRPVKLGIRRHQGSMALRRKQIIIDIVEQAGGVFPGERELVPPFSTAWAKTEKNALIDYETVKRAANNSVLSGALQRFVFASKLPGGATVTRSILCLPGISPSDEKVKDMEKKMTESGRYSYIPQGIEIAPQFQHCEPQERWKSHLNRTKPLFPLDHTAKGKVSAVRRPGPSVKGRQQEPAWVRWAEKNKVKVTSVPKISAKAKKDGHEARVQEEELAEESEPESDLDPEQAAMQSKFKLASYSFEPGNTYRKWHGKSVRYSQKIELEPKPRFPKEKLPWINPHSWISGKENTPAPRTTVRKSRETRNPTLTSPDQAMHAPTGTFSTDFVVTRKSRPLLSIRPHLQHDFEQEIPQNVAEIVRQEESWNKNAQQLHRTCDQLFKEIDQVEMWEKRASDLLASGKQLAEPRFLNHTVPEDVWAEMEPLAKKAFGEVSQISLPSGGINDANATRSKPTRTKQAKPSKESKAICRQTGADTRVERKLLPAPLRSSESTRRDDEAANATLEPVSSALKDLTGEQRPSRLELRGNAIQPAEEHEDSETVAGGPKRGPRRPRPKLPLAANGSRVTPSDQIPRGQLKRFFAIVVAVRTLVGRPSQSVSWALVARILASKFDAADLRYRWTTIQKIYISQVEEFQRDFERLFLEGYESGNIPRIDYRCIQDYDWQTLTDYVLSNTVTPFEDDIHDLPASKVAVATAEDQSLSYEIPKPQLFSYRTTRTRCEEIAKDTSFNLPLCFPEGKVQDVESACPSEFVLAKSYVRANCLTPQASYNPSQARQKLASLNGNAIDDAITSLTGSRAFRKKNHGRLVPGRNWEPTQGHATAFAQKDFANGPDTIAGAIGYKSHLDEHEEKQRTVDENLSMIVEAKQQITNEQAIVLLNLYAARRIDLTPQVGPTTREIQGTPEFPEKALSLWGVISIGQRFMYNSRLVDMNKVNFPLEVRPTETYVKGTDLVAASTAHSKGEARDSSASTMGNVLKATGPSAEGRSNEASKLIPYWRSIHGEMVPGLFRRLVSVVLSILSQQPGITALGLATQLGAAAAIDVWEVMELLQLLKSKGTVKLCREALNGLTLRLGGRDVKEEGWVLVEGWWCALRGWFDEKKGAPDSRETRGSNEIANLEAEETAATTGEVADVVMDDAEEEGGQGDPVGCVGEGAREVDGDHDVTASRVIQDLDMGDANE